ncbi:methyltransferase domain-containing protein [Streptomyces sp. NPDC048106]|uniref:class I SAM-dependent methyltransferase n=1 Tax=Streptomyces sp. NPDC048106 TaxID=3155750 RepID=UPI003454FBC3
MNPSEAKAARAAVFDRSAAAYEQVGPQFFGPFGRLLVERARIRPGDRLLDVGCGRGHVLFPAAEATGPGGSVVGIDLAPTMVSLTAEAAAHLPHVTIALGDAAVPDFPDGDFDLILAGLVIFFLPEPEHALLEYRRLLRPGGRLAFSTFGRQDPVFDRAMKTLGSFVPPRPGGNPPDRPADRFRDRASTTDLLAGWSGIEITEHTLETRFTGPQQWWEWIQSHGARRVVELLPADRLGEAKAAAFDVMEAARTADGDLAIHTELRITTAHP